LGFINVSETLLMDDLLDVLPCDKVVLEILETVKVTPLAGKAGAIARKGFRLAMDDVIELDADRRPCCRWWTSSRLTWWRSACCSCASWWPAGRLSRHSAGGEGGHGGAV
jgi:EAL and modified HD-GYP domain-containing signal transduction protein